MCNTDHRVEKEPWTLEPPLCFGLLAVAVAVLLVAFQFDGIEFGFSFEFWMYLPSV